jgi:hypothetical protein
MHAKFVARLAELYGDDALIVANELRATTAQEREARGMEVPVLCTNPGQLA